MRPEHCAVPLALTPAALAAALALGWPTLVLAQATGADAASSQRVEVTARRRVESQIDVPASVTAISGEGLKAFGSTHVDDIIALVPNANVTENPRGFDTYVSIRGMRQADVGAEPNFGMYRNGVFAGGHRVNLGSQIDVQRVEIVRGPQGGLYGRDAVGGAVNVIYTMPRPGEKAGGYVSAGLENVGTRVEGAASVPLGDAAAVRGTVWSLNQHKGDYYNVTLGEEIDRSRDQGLRLSGAANLGGALSGTVTFEAGRAESPSLRTYAPSGIANGPAAKSPVETRRTVQRDTPSRNDIDQKYLAGRLNWDLGGGSLSLMASVRDYHLSATQDQDQTALALSAGPLVLKQVVQRHEDIKQRYAELLWQSDPAKAFSWSAGLSYFNEDFGLEQAFATTLDSSLLGFLGVPNLGVIGGSAGIPSAGSAYTVGSWAAFADMRYQFTKQLAATATLRRTVDRLSLHWVQGIDPSSHPVAAALFAGVVPTFTLDSRDTYSFTAPALGLEFKVDKDLNAYAVYSTGYRPGGYNTSVTNPLYIPYGQESARNLEAGVKMLLLDGRAAMNLSVFRMEQKDLLVQQDDPGDSRFGFTYLANVGKARTNGFEFELLGQLDRQWNLGLSVGHLDAGYTEGVINAGTPQQVDVSGRVLQGVRPWTVNAKLDFRSGSAQGEFSAGAVVRREIGGAMGDLSDVPLEALTRLDLYVGYRMASQTQLNLYVRNALDRQIETFRFANGAVGTNTGRRFGLQLTQRF